MPDKDVTDALAQFEHSAAGSTEVRARAHDDWRFARDGLQWDGDDEKTRRLERRPCLTINRLPIFIRQVVNDARQNKPSIDVAPVDNGADYDTAQVIEGLVRSIERVSNAGTAYDTAIDCAVTGGFGFFRLEMDFAHPESFDQELRIARVVNPFSVHWDVDSFAADASDWRYAFVSEMLPEKEFKRRYPKASPVDWQAGIGDNAAWRGTEGQTRIAEWWTRTEAKTKLYGFDDGSAMTRPAAISYAKAQLAQMGMGDWPLGDDELIGWLFTEVFGSAPTRERVTAVPKVRRRIISGAEVLADTDWPGLTIPIAPVWGEEFVIDGQRRFQGLVRAARDPQRMLNFWRSASTELVALAPKAPWLLHEDAVIPEEMDRWETANTRSHAYLMWKGQISPQRNQFAGVPAGALQEALNASDDIKATTGIFDAGLGARGNETSGRAINARQRESDNATFHFIDNLSRAIQYIGRCTVDCIPAVYSARQTIQIIGADQETRVVRLSQQSGGAMGPDGKPALYNISAGRYDVAVSAGPSYATQRQETRDALMQIAQQQPGAALIVGDLLMASMDFPQADEAAKRIKLMQAMELARAGLPPTVDGAMAAIEAGEWPPKPPPSGPPGMPQGMPTA